MADTTYTNIDEYITLCPVEHQPLLQKVRETIQKAAPEATEKISWQMPLDKDIPFDLIERVTLFRVGENDHK